MWLKRLGSDERHNLASDIPALSRERFVPLNRYYRSPTIKGKRSTTQFSFGRQRAPFSTESFVRLVNGPGCFFQRHAA